MVHVEDLGVPAVVVCNEGFLADARAAAAVRGRPGLRLVPTALPPDCLQVPQIEAAVESIFNDVIDGLSRPLTKEEAAPTAPPTVDVPRRAFRGTTVQVNRHYYKMGWTDGLPIIPPTEEALAEMLQGTDLPPHHVVGRIPPRMGKATVEKIAINAIMAGALPTYLPVIIAALEAVLDPRTCFGTYQVSTGSWAPFWVVNGPIRKQLHLNSGSGALSPGNMANAAIGRALSLIIRNIGGARPGIEDMGVMGNPGRYTMVLAENEEESPWEALHVEQGLREDDSAVSVFWQNTYLQILAYGSDPQGILNTLIYNVPPGKKDAIACILMMPRHAKTLAEAGWRKQDVAAFVSEFAQAPAYQHLEYVQSQSLGRRTGNAPLPFGPLDPVRILRHPDRIRVVVAGGPGDMIALVLGGGAMPVQWSTARVRLPRKWSRLVDRYRGMVPRQEAVR